MLETILFSLLLIGCWGIVNVTAVNRAFKRFRVGAKPR